MINALVCAMKPPPIRLADGSVVVKYTPADVATRLRAAAKALKDMPMPKHSMPREYGTRYPDVLQGYWEFWNSFVGETPDAAEEARFQKRRREEEMNYTRTVVSSADIAAMDEVLEWLLLIKQPRNRKVVWARAHEISYRDIARFDKRSYETIRRVWNQALEDIAKHLNRSGHG